MRLNVIKRISAQDYKPEYQELVQQLAEPINQFMEQVALGFNKNLTIQDNIPFEIKIFDVTVDASGVPTNTVAFKLPIKPKGMHVIRAENVQDSTALSGAPFCQYDISSSSIISLTRVLGLPADKKFNLTILIIS